MYVSVKSILYFSHFFDSQYISLGQNLNNRLIKRKDNEDKLQFFTFSKMLLYKGFVLHINNILNLVQVMLLTFLSIQSFKSLILECYHIILSRKLIMHNKNYNPGLNYNPRLFYIQHSY